MVAITINQVKYLDIYEFVKQAKLLGANEKYAEFEARQIETSIEVAVEQIRKELKSNELITKSDLEITKLSLQKDIADAKLELQKEISNTRIQTLIWIGVNTAFILGIMAKGFHWW